MTTPSFAQWRGLSVDNTQVSLPPMTLQQRMLAALAAMASQQNPDGTTKGS